RTLSRQRLSTVRREVANALATQDGAHAAKSRRGRSVDCRKMPRTYRGRHRRHIRPSRSQAAEAHGVRGARARGRTHREGRRGQSCSDFEREVVMTNREAVRVKYAEAVAAIEPYAKFLPKPENAVLEPQTETNWVEPLAKLIGLGRRPGR